MKRVMFKSLLLTGLCLLASLASANTMDEEIDYLLGVVAESDCTFIRNGKDHSAADAVDHLQLKRRRGKRYFDSADEFIENLASKSSWSGKPYFIQCGDKPEMPSGEWFTALLNEYRADSGR